MHTQNFIVSFAVATVAISTQVLPVFAQVGPGSYSRNVSSTYTCTHSNDIVNIRSGPGKNFRIVRQVYSGVNVYPYDGAQGRDGFTWRKVNVNGSVGWVRGDYLCG
jgi:uncharacterized protein YraI